MWPRRSAPPLPANRFAAAQRHSSPSLAPRKPGTSLRPVRFRPYPWRSPTLAQIEAPALRAARYHH